MNKHTEFLKRFAAEYLSLDGTQKPILDAAAEIERLESDLATARHELNTVGHITADRLSSLLVKRGVIQEAAVADPDGYDGGRTEDAINAVVSELKGKP